MPKTYLVLIFSVFLIFFPLSRSNAQIRFKGVVIDRDTQEPIPYASLGIIGTYMGTVANDVGEFELYLPDIDTIKLKVTSIGYRPLTMTNIIHDKKNVIMLNPSAIVLNEIVVKAIHKDPLKLLKKAFRSVKKNYITDPFTMKVFYRHYCQDDTIYGRLIEAAGEIYKPKGYSWKEGMAINKYETHLSQLRRSFDMTLFEKKNNHVPIGVDIVMGNDLVGYPGIKNALSNFLLIKLDSSGSLKNTFKFEYNGTTTYDGHTVYKIGYQYKAEHEKKVFGSWTSNYQQYGELLINQDDYAIVKAENSYNIFSVKNSLVAYYRKNKGKYVLSHLIYKSSSKQKSGSTHKAHIEMLVNDVIPGKDKLFQNQEMTSKQLSLIPYNPDFWKEYNIIRKNKLEEEITNHLERKMSLKKQFALKQEQEKLLNDEELNQAKLLEGFINTENERIVMVNFWSAEANSDISEMRKFKKVFNLYKKRGVTFLLVSLDDKASKQQWRKILKLPPFNEFRHYRIGQESRKISGYEVKGMHHYAAFYKGRKLNIDFPLPSNPDFIKLLDDAISQLKPEMNN